MKKVFLVLSVIFLFSFIVSEARGKKDEPRFSKREKEKIELIKKVKEFGEELGLEPTNNFKEYQEKVSKYNIFFFNEKTVVPYSYVDPLITVVQSPHDNLKDSIRHYEIDLEKYDVYFYVTIGVSGGTYITKRLLAHSDRTIADTVLHEDLHDNINLPRHLEESIALLFGVAGASRYLKDSDKDFRSTMGFALVDAILLDDLHGFISSLNQERINGKISMREYLEKRDAKIANSWYKSMAEIAQHHTYKHYFVLWYRLFKVMNFDLKKLIVYLKEFPFEQPSFENGHEDYFEETLRVEALAEVFIENSIASLTVDSAGTATETFDTSDEILRLINEFYRNDNLLKHPPIMPEEPERHLLKK